MEYRIIKNRTSAQLAFIEDFMLRGLGKATAKRPLTNERIVIVPIPIILYETTDEWRMVDRHHQPIHVLPAHRCPVSYVSHEAMQSLFGYPQRMTVAGYFGWELGSVKAAEDMIDKVMKVIY